MNAPRKKSAVAKYQSLYDNGASIEDLELSIAGDEKGYTPDEVKEISAAIVAGPAATSGNDGDQGNQQAPPPPPPPKPTPVIVKETKEDKPKSLNVNYEEWKVKPIYEDVVNEEGRRKGRKLIGYEKDSAKPIRVTSITPDKADLLNSQSENTLLRLYPVE